MDAADEREPDAAEPRLVRRLRRLAGWRTPPPRWRGAVLLAAAGVFVVGVVLALRAIDLDVGQLRWWPLVVVAVVGTPATIAANAAELRAMARCVDPALRLPWSQAVRVVVLATAANLLPLPGGALVRVHALTSRGVRVSRATAVNLVAAGLWVATAVGLAGVAGLVAAAGGASPGGAAASGAPPVVAWAGVAVGVVGSVAALLALRGVARVWSWRAAAGLALVEVVTTLVHAARLALVLMALAVPVVATQALVLGAAAPLAAAAGVFPAGLGLAELLSALLAPLAALPAAAGLLATAVARLVGLVATAPIALALGVRDARPGLPADTAPTDRPAQDRPAQDRPAQDRPGDA